MPMDHLHRRKTPKQQRARDRDKRILDAAEQAIYEKGYSAASMASIARDAAVSLPSLYQHFSSKDGVLAALLERRSLLIDTEGAVALGQLTSPDWRTIMRENLQAFYRLNRKRPSLDSIFIAAQTIPSLRDAERVHMRERAARGAPMTAAITGIALSEELIDVQLAGLLVSASIVRHALTCNEEIGERLVDEAFRFLEARLVALGAN
jgi:AcrR family transcriptional regulator